MLRRPRAWTSPELGRGVAAGLAALLVHALFLALVGALPGRELGASERLRPEPREAPVSVSLEGFETPAPSVSVPAPSVSASVPTPLRTAGLPAAPAVAATPPPSREVVAAPPPAPSPPAAPEMLDFSSAPIAHGLASAYVGVTRVAAGASQALGAITAGASGAGSPSGAGTQATGVATPAAQPVRLADRAPRCPWPSAAMAADIYQQTVMLRVEVDADGSVVRVSALSDPGYGFAAAAEACARRTRFTAARDASGQPIRATSPPIRMHFER